MRITLCICICIIIGNNSYLHAQNNYTQVDKTVLQLPEAESKTTDGIARYIDAHFGNPNDKARAIFCWITHNMAYDVENMYNMGTYQNPHELVERILKTRKGVCMSYAELFNEIAAKTGLQSVTVHGYTKQNNKVDILPHAWNAVRIGNEWYLIDATWGAGYVDKGKFFRTINESHFKPSPQTYIQTHMPFDPLWQMTGYTVSNPDFYDGKTTPLNHPRFDYKDSIASYLALPETEQLAAAARRIQANGVKNTMIYDRLQQIRQETEYNRALKNVNLYNDAVKHYNESIALLNQFINYRNAQFTPKKSDAEIRRMVDTIDIELAASKRIMQSIHNPDAQTASSIRQMNPLFEQLAAGINEQKAFIEKYFKTAKLFRKTLFYKYTWMGVPVN